MSIYTRRNNRDSDFREYIDRLEDRWREERKESAERLAQDRKDSEARLAVDRKEAEARLEQDRIEFKAQKYWLIAIFFTVLFGMGGIFAAIVIGILALNGYF